MASYLTDTELIINDKNFIDIIYPVGSIYLSINSANPSTLFGGTWVMLDAGYALWTASSEAGITISAGLPNITGEVVNNSSSVYEVLSNLYASDTSSTGALGPAKSKQARRGITTTSNSFNNIWDGVTFDASKSNSIYGNSDTVQPPAIKVYAWKRTA